jgi:hypothetical protein
MDDWLEDTYNSNSNKEPKKEDNKYTKTTDVNQAFDQIAEKCFVEYKNVTKETETKKEDVKKADNSVDKLIKEEKEEKNKKNKNKKKNKVNEKKNLPKKNCDENDDDDYYEEEYGEYQDKYNNYD